MAGYRGTFRLKPTLSRKESERPRRGKFHLALRIIGFALKRTPSGPRSLIGAGPQGCATGSGAAIGVNIVRKFPTQVPKSGCWGNSFTKV